MRWPSLHKTAAPKGRYVTDQWKHGPDWTFYGEGGDDWFGFKGVRALGDREPDVLMIPLPGHTPGHCGIAVRAKHKWLLHAGDSYFFHGQLQAKVADAAGARLFSAQGRPRPQRCASPIRSGCAAEVNARRMR